MSETPRREFLKQSSLGLAGAAALSLASADAADADKKSEPLRIGLIGCGGRGSFVAMNFAKQPDARIVVGCDPDQTRQATFAKRLTDNGFDPPKLVSDMRQVLDDKTVDAVIIGTCDHWHAPATLLALAAGKHVYVEKPCSHNVREGRLMVEAAKRTGLVVQTGTQSRSGPYLIEAVKKVRDGAIGEVLVAKAWNSQLRRNIGHAQPSEPPSDLDYPLWLGPVPEVPFQANLHPYNWHWWYSLGTGDMGNDGVHQLDIARWGLGVDQHPSRIAALGGKSFFDDDQQFPDTQYAVFEYPRASGRDLRLVYEQRIWCPYDLEGIANGVAYYGTEGYMTLSNRDGWKLYGRKNKLLESQPASDRDIPHVRDFLDCIRHGGTPRAGIEIGHTSATLSHLGNIATRVGRVLHFDPQREQIIGDDEANKLLTREYRPGHWATPAGV